MDAIPSRRRRGVGGAPGPVVVEDPQAGCEVGRAVESDQPDVGDVLGEAFALPLRQSATTDAVDEVLVADFVRDRVGGVPLPDAEARPPAGLFTERRDRTGATPTDRLLSFKVTKAVAF